MKIGLRLIVFLLSTSLVFVPDITAAASPLSSLTSPSYRTSFQEQAILPRRLASGTVITPVPPAVHLSRAIPIKDSDLKDLNLLLDAIAQELRNPTLGKGADPCIYFFLRDGKFRSTWIGPGTYERKGEVTLKEYAEDVTKSRGLSMPEIDDWTWVADAVWKRLRLNKADLVRTIHEVLTLENEQLKKIPRAARWQARLPGTMRWDDYTEAGHDSRSIDDARRMEQSAGFVKDAHSARPLSDAELSELVEQPAQSLVRRIEKAGGLTFVSNAFGPWVKGVIWTDDVAQPFKYFTPLTINDYNVDILDAETFVAPTRSPDSKDDPDGKPSGEHSNHSSGKSGGNPLTHLKSILSDA